MSARHRLIVSRGLLLTEPRAVIDDNEGPAYCTVGHTIRWRIPLEFTVNDGCLAQIRIAQRMLPAIITRVHDGHVDLRLELETRTYVRYAHGF